MKIKKNSKGFTLVELIVAITILGIISLISLPIIGNISIILREKKEETYKTTIESSAKLYVDSHAMDLFGYQSSGCVDIYYNTLVESKLMEDINFDDYGVKKEDVFVRVIKTNDVYTYEIYFPKSQDEKDAIDYNACDGSVKDEGPRISVTPDGNASPTRTDKLSPISIIIEDTYGFAANISFKYSWIDAKTEKTVGSDVTKKLQNKAVAGSQKKEISVTPPSSTGNFILKVSPINVRDYVGNATTEDVKSKIFYIDNTPPNIVVEAYEEKDGNKTGNILATSSSGKLEITSWSKKGYYLDFSGSSDSNGIKTQKWEWNDKGNVTLNKTIPSGNKEEDKGVVSKPFTDPGARYAKLTMTDVAGNSSSVEVTLYISPTYKIKYNGNSADSGSVGDTTCYYGFNCKLANNDFTKNGYTFLKWTINNKDYDAGSNVSNLSSTNGGSVTAKAKWAANTYTITYKGNGNTGGSTSKTTCTYDQACKLETNGFTKTGYTFTKWTINGKEYDAGKSVTNLTTSGNVDATAGWTVTTYSVSYDANGGSGAPSSGKKEYGKDYTIPTTTPTRSGWEFLGWGTSNNTTTVAYKPGDKYSTNGALKLYAIWKKTITVKFNVNKALWLSTPSNQSCTIYNSTTGCNFKAPSIFTNFPGENREGLKFSDMVKARGWNSNKDATSSSWDAGATKFISDSVTYYAVYTLESYYTNSKYEIISGNGLKVRRSTDWEAIGTMHYQTLCRTYGANDWIYRDIDTDPLWLRVTQYSGDGVICGSDHGQYGDNTCDGWSSATFLSRRGTA